MDNRESIRYPLAYENSSSSREQVVNFEIDLNGIIRGRAIDISLLGLGLVIHDISESQIESLKNEVEIFINLFFQNENILLGVKSVWNRLLSETGKMVLKSGVKITIIAPDDKLRLLRLIEKIRND